MTTTIIVAIVAVVVALLIAVPVTCKVAVNNKNPEGCRDCWDSRRQSKKHHR